MNNEKIKIGVIGLKGFPAFGGAAAVGENLINQLKGKYEFFVYATSSHTSYKTDTYNNVNHIVFNKLPFKKLNTLYYYIISALHAFFLGKYDLIHLHHRDAAFIILLLKLKYKIMITTHSSFFIRNKWKRYAWYFKTNERYFVKKANIVTCVSEDESKKYKELTNADAIYIPNGININESENDYKRYIEEDYLFFGAGRIIKSKGLEVLLKAIKYSNINLKLVVAGDIEQTPEYKKEILQLADGLDVEFVGLIKEKEKLFGYLNYSKIFIFPSSFEGMSMMLLEAASLKVPTICSNILANTAIFNEDEVLFFEVDNHVSLAEEIIWALNNMEVMRIKAENAFEKLKLEYQWKNIAVKYDVLYQKLLTNSQAFVYE